MEETEIEEYEEEEEEEEEEPTGKSEPQQLEQFLLTRPCSPEFFGRIMSAGLEGACEATVLSERTRVGGLNGASSKDKYKFTFGPPDWTEDLRKDFMLFLQSTGLLQIIAKFILALHEMPDRPPPEQALEFLFKTMTSKLNIRDMLQELKDLRDEAKLRVDDLIKESEELKLRLENYEPVYTQYETLDPDDFKPKPLVSMYMGEMEGEGGGGGDAGEGG